MQGAQTSEPAVRLSVFLTEDDRVGRRSAAEELLERARSAGLAGVTIWRALEGFGRGGHVRDIRRPDRARGAPLVVEIVDDEERVTGFVPLVRELVPGALVTIEHLELRRPAAPLVRG